MSYDRAEIEVMVREVVARTLGPLSPIGSRQRQANIAQRPILDQTAVAQMPAHSTQEVPTDAIITPLAWQTARERHITLREVGAEPGPPRWRIPQGKPVIALGADHGGYQLKEQLKSMLASADLGYTVIDCGTHSNNSVDYPDYAYAVARLVADGRAWRGIIVDGAGIGSCMTANKVPGVLAAMCYDQATAVNSREHNNANVLTLGSGLIGPNLAQQIVKTWLNTEFGGGRHARRVDKIKQIEKRFSR